MKVTMNLIDVRRWPRALGLTGAALLMALGAPVTGCNEDGLTLPEDFNGGRYRKITISATSKQIGQTVTPLTGMDGAPKPILTGDYDLTTAYWGKYATDVGPDGAHLSMVRVGTGTVCDLSLEGIFPNPGKDPSKAADYNFTVLDQHMKAATDVHTAAILWQVGFNPGANGGCKTSGNGQQAGTPISSQEPAKATWVNVAVNTLRHLRGGDSWDKDNGKNYPVGWVEFMDDPVGAMGYPEAHDTSWDTLYEVYGRFAEGVKQHFPDDPERGPTVHVGGMGFHVKVPAGAKADDYFVGKPPVTRFIDWIAKDKAPLDFISFRTTTNTPFQAAEVAREIRAYLDAKGLQATKLVMTGADYFRDDAHLQTVAMMQNEHIKSAYLGAFQTAVRIFIQDVGVAHFIAGRGPRVYSDLRSHAGEDPGSLKHMIVESDYFHPRTPSDPCANQAWDVNKPMPTCARPAYMAMFPFRQVNGHVPVTVTSGHDAEGMTAMASFDKASDDVMHIIVANANVAPGTASITYDLVIDNFVPATIRAVKYSLAVIDRNSYGVPSFHFSETGTVETNPQTGSVRFVHEMAVPSVHYIQLEKIK